MRGHQSASQARSGISALWDNSSEQKEPHVEQLLPRPEDGDDGEIQVDAGSGTRLACIVGAAVGASAAIACLICGAYFLGTNRSVLGAKVAMSTLGQELLSMAINVVLTFCIDGMMFVHSTSLRWALYREGRLEHNTNLRLLTSSKKAGPNAWYANVVALSCLVLSYAASSVLFIPVPPYMIESDQTVQDMASTPPSDLDDPGPSILVNATALVALGIALAGQAAIAFWSLNYSQRLIPTWSSNPLTNVLAALQKGDLTHRPWRCMLSIHQRDHWSNEAIRPAKRQGSVLQARPTVGYVLALLWILVLFAIAWPVAIAMVSMSIGNASAAGQNQPPSCWRAGFAWDKDEGACSRNYVTMSLSPSANSHDPNSGTFSYGVQAVLCVLFVCLLQASQTIALHSVELLVNLSRDERVWRQAYSDTKRGAKGARLATNPFLAALSSWETIVLFVAKALLHWIVGQSLLPSIGLEENGAARYSSFSDEGSSMFRYGFQFDMVYSRLLVFAILVILLSVFATYLALTRPHGPQPSALGHLQTLADLIDDWKTDYDGRLWWGDKSSFSLAEDHVRHAGTSGMKATVAPICVTATYAGGDD